MTDADTIAAVNLLYDALSHEAVWPGTVPGGEPSSIRFAGDPRLAHAAHGRFHRPGDRGNPYEVSSAGLRLSKESPTWAVPSG